MNWYNQKINATEIDSFPSAKYIPPNHMRKQTEIDNCVMCMMDQLL